MSSGEASLVGVRVEQRTAEVGRDGRGRSKQNDLRKVNNLRTIGYIFLILVTF